MVWNKEKQKEYYLNWYEKNKEIQREKGRKYYQENKEKRLLNTKEWCKKNPDKVRELSRKKNIKYREKGKIKRREIKLKIINAYGGKCACCGENIPEFLTLEHIKGGGQKERKALRSKYSCQSLYKKLINENFPSGYSILCFNCNITKGIYGKCPHNL
jgi:RNA polymerase-binding transcription factor DksA